MHLQDFSTLMKQEASKNGKNLYKMRETKKKSCKDLLNT